jgi:hypothetical protein
VTTEASNKEDDKGQYSDDCSDDQLDLHVLPPHFAAQLPPCLVEFVSLHVTSKVSTAQKGINLPAMNAHACKDTYM